MKEHIIIIGAGASGLTAARQLSAERYKVTLLESRAVCGGRIRSEILSDGRIIEPGAEFIHGRLPITLGICAEANIKVVPTEGRMYRRTKGRWETDSNMFDDWDEILNKMKNTKPDTTLTEFLRLNYAGDKYDELRLQIRGYAQGFDLADPDKVSVHFLAGEWSAEDEENFHVTGGYAAIIEFLERQCSANGCEIHTGDPVRQIDWTKGEVTVTTTAGKKYSGEKLLITVPPAVLTNIAGPDAINFTPPIDTQIRAAADIGFGTVIKFVFVFRRRLWQPDTRFIFSDEIIPTWWTQLPSDLLSLTGWIGGPPAASLAAHTDEALLTIAQNSLANIFDIDRQGLIDVIESCHVYNWLRDPHAMGAYAYSTIYTDGARAILREPVQETVYFAGEALYIGQYPGTVEAAFASGLEVSEQMIVRK